MGMKKILVIDYDQGSLASLQGILSREGYQVVTASDGQAGWEKFNKESPDLVLMEAMLPKVHGFELCQRITSDRNSLTPVFIMTGVYKDRVYRTEALRTYGASVL
jgi:two-component system response regulator ResD